MTLEMCTLDTQTTVDPRYIWFPSGLSLCYYNGDVYKLLLILDTLRCSLVLSYGISLEMCTLDTQTVIDPKYTSLSPGLTLLNYLGDVYPGYTICCRS